MPVVVVTGCDEPWPSILVSSLLTKIGIVYTWLLQVEKIFLVIPRSEYLAYSAWDMHKNAQKVEWKTLSYSTVLSIRAGSQPKQLATGQPLAGYFGLA